MGTKVIDAEFRWKWKWWVMPFTHAVACVMLLPKTEWMAEWAGKFIANYGVKEWTLSK